MVVRRAYSRIKVNSVDIDQLTANTRGVAQVSVGLDIGKHEIVACLRWGQEDFERPWSVRNPAEIGALVELCVQLNKVFKVVVALESTGTYGDAIRRAFTIAKIPVMRVAGKFVYDYQEIFDGVPSQHDGKDAAIIAELSALGKGATWDYVAEPEMLSGVRYHVRSMDHAQNEFVRLVGKLEASVARHWPELTRHLSLTTLTSLRLLAKYGSPQEAAKDSQLSAQLRKWSSRLTDVKISRIVDTAHSDVGIPMDSYETRWVKELAALALETKLKVLGCSKGIEALLLKDPFWCNYVKDVGAATLGVLLTTAGDPRSYPNGGSLVKSLGLNLKERSSGARKGELAITKRGPALARRWFYFWALRSVQRPELKEWFHKFQATLPGQVRKDHRKMKGLVCLMRKLTRSLRRAVCDGVAFDYAKITGQPKLAKRKRRRKTKSSVAKYPPDNSEE